MRHYLLLLTFFILASSASSQNIFSNGTFTRQDSLRGSITKERKWWDLQRYELSVAVDISTQAIRGTNVVRYKVLEDANVMQIDLQAPMVLQKAIQDGQQLEIRHEGNAHFISLKKNQTAGAVESIILEFSGKPTAAKNAPWDGGFSWKKDSNGKDFIATSCQGIGASLWWPCKDHMYDEPDNGMTIGINVPAGLVAVSNGRLKSEKSEKNKTKTFTWEVVNPINNYGVNLNIGDYVRFSEKYKGEKGMLDMDYWVLRSNLEKAKIHFKDATRMMEAFENWFGPYPFYEDSYKLVEVPYLGMEHQSSVTYGNNYGPGYLGSDLSNTGWGLKWDYIIIHESGHEWFANNITYKDIADMWIHEGFTCYSEAIFIEHFYGKEAAAEYVRGLRLGIGNSTPIIGKYDVNSGGSGDMYSKGSNMLHTLRQVANDDNKWKAMLRGLNKEFYHKTVTTKEIEDYIAKSLGMNLKPFFDQYLRDYRIPVLEYRIQGDNLIYRWTNCIDSFNMRVKILTGGTEKVLTPTTRPKVEKLNGAQGGIKVDPNFYVYSSNTME
jgi:aminopeptidase N